MTRSKGRRGHTRGPVVQGEVQSRLHVVRDGTEYQIGDLTGTSEPAPPLIATFGYFGETIRVNPDLTEVDMIDFLDSANSVDQNDPKSMTMVKDLVRAHVHPDDFDQFWELRRKNRQGVQATVATVWQIVAAVTQRPTGRPSDSSGGPPVTSQPLPDTSSPQAGPPSPRDLYLKHIERFETDPRLGANGVAMAAQLAVAAEARGIDVSRNGPSLVTTG
jgi:hypothetical protein